MAQQRRVGRAILTDSQFWVPVIVLVAGLLVLHWMQ
jgi:hypothetical protein